jgi:hypothetical protein
VFPSTIYEELISAYTLILLIVFKVIYFILLFNVSGYLAAAIKKIKGDYEAASATGAAALPKAIDAQNAMTSAL